MTRFDVLQFGILVALGYVSAFLAVAAYGRRSRVIAWFAAVFAVATVGQVGLILMLAPVR